MGNVTQWSKYQQDIFTFAEETTGSAIVNAVAGSGKSTTLVELVSRLKGSTILLAFNKSIADELKAKGVNARTFHSLCFSPVLRHKKLDARTGLNEKKLWKIVESKFTGDDAERYGSFVVKLVSLARQIGIGALVPDTDQAWFDIINHHDLEPDDEEADIGRAVELAQKTLAFSNRMTNMIDFDDMLYLAVKDGLNLQKFDNILVDEAQDTNPIRRAIIRKIMHKNSRVFAVGDRAQAIYGFTGADSNSLDLIAEEFNCKELPLSISYRCPTSVVNYARTWVDHIEAREGAPEGTVEELGGEWDSSVFQPEDLVVCRTTAPIISLAFKLMKDRVPVRVMGREIGEGLKKLVKRMDASTIDELEVKLEAFTTREVEKAVAKKEEAKAERIQDKSDAIFILMDGLVESERTVQALLNTIDSLFNSKRGAVVLSTIHKAKGLEAERVFWLNRAACPAQWATQPWQQQQEENLCYVAATRAKSALFTIEAEQDS